MDNTSKSPLSDAEYVLQEVEAAEKKRRRLRPEILHLFADEEELLRLDAKSSNVKINLPNGTDILSLVAYESDGNPLTMGIYVLFYNEAKVETFGLVVAGFGKIKCKLVYDAEDNVTARFRVTPEGAKKIHVVKKTPTAKKAQTKRSAVKTVTP